MDLLGEASNSNGRVLTARHVGVDRLAPVIQDAVNSTFLCHSAEVPDVKTYLNVINVYGVVLFTCGGLALLVLLALYCDTLRAVLRCRRTDIKTNTALVTAVYPTVGAASYCAVVVPRAQLLTEALTQGVFTVCMYQLFCLFPRQAVGAASYCAVVVPRAQLLAEALTQGVFTVCMYQLFCLFPRQAGAASYCAVVVPRAQLLAEALTQGVFTVCMYQLFCLFSRQAVGAASYCAVVVPRAQLLAEALTQGVFTVCMYQLFCLIVAYCGGEAELIRRVKPARLETRVAPCCCWPCCLLPRPAIDKRTLRWLRLLVLQLPLVQGALYVVLLVMWADEQSLQQVNQMYVQPVVVTSIVCGVWGVVMVSRAAAAAAPAGGAALRLRGKFLALQLVLVAAKLQGSAARLLPAAVRLLPCHAPLTPAVYANLIYNCVMMAEMVVLAVWARQLYRCTPELDTAPAPVQHVKIIHDLAQHAKVDQPRHLAAGRGVSNTAFDAGKNY